MWQDQEHVANAQENRVIGGAGQRFGTVHANGSQSICRLVIYRGELLQSCRGSYPVVEHGAPGRASFLRTAAPAREHDAWRPVVHDPRHPNN